MALLDSGFSQLAKTSPNQLAREAELPALCVHGEVVNVTTAAVVADKDCSNDSIALDGNKAQTRVAVQEEFDALTGVGITEPDTFGFFP